MVDQVFNRNDYVNIMIRETLQLTATMWECVKVVRYDSVFFEVRVKNLENTQIFRIMDIITITRSSVAW